MTDQEKAFDRVSWSFLHRALERYGFGPAFCAAVCVLYNGSASCVQVNGWASATFALQRSVRQGDSLSPLLCNLVDNCLAAATLRDPAYGGLGGLRLRLPAPCPKIAVSLYADDKAFFAHDAGDVAVLAGWLVVHGQATGARINWAKCRGLWLSADPFPLPALMAPLQWVPLGDRVTYLGVPIGRDARMTEVWGEVAGKMEATLALWRARNLSSRGRLTEARSLATSRLWHVASVCPLPSDTLKRIERAVQTFFWKGKRAGVVRRSVCATPPELGGLSMFDVEGVVKALHVQWLARLVQPAAAAWKSLVWAALARAAPPHIAANPRDLLTACISTGRLEFSGPFGIWGDAVQTWLALGGSARSGPNTYSEVLGQALFWNQWILDPSEQPLGTLRHDGAMVAVGIVRLRDVWDRHAADWFQPGALGITRAALARVQDAIPARWLELLRLVRALVQCFLLARAPSSDMDDAVLDINEVAPLLLGVTAGIVGTETVVSAHTVSSYGEVIPMDCPPADGTVDADFARATVHSSTCGGGLALLL